MDKMAANNLTWNRVGLLARKNTFTFWVVTISTSLYELKKHTHTHTHTDVLVKIAAILFCLSETERKLCSGDGPGCEASSKVRKAASLRRFHRNRAGKRRKS